MASLRKVSGVVVGLRSLAHSDSVNLTILSYTFGEAVTFA